ncbi:MAG: hypothetical protein H0T44_05190 [Gemmatimonadales bacterium]|nr:hypothetical protein [Gemmatimonadales bacterium]MDQ3427650.1 hypothetical protein [Gemmatimonadota bacterium]
MSPDARRPWEGDGNVQWDTPDQDWGPGDGDGWRGKLHLGDWPEDLAGPEYWLYKRQRDE